jgi:hypothetical protein
VRLIQFGSGDALGVTDAVDGVVKLGPALGKRFAGDNEVIEMLPLGLELVLDCAGALW